MFCSFKKNLLILIMLLFIFEIAYADEIFIKKIGKDPNNDWLTEFSINFNVNGKIILLDRDFHSDCYKNDMDNINNYQNCLSYFDINSDGINDYIVKLKQGRGNPDLFFVINGKNLKIVFNCKESKGKNFFFTEGRGSKSFEFDKNWIKEKIIIPNDNSYFKKQYLYIWNKKHKKFIFIDGKNNN